MSSAYPRHVLRGIPDRLLFPRACGDTEWTIVAMSMAHECGFGMSFGSNLEIALGAYLVTISNALDLEIPCRLPRISPMHCGIPLTIGVLLKPPFFESTPMVFLRSFICPACVFAALVTGAFLSRPVAKAASRISFRGL
ncbi:unnamed protein product, partial [Ectocarpus fasciculatus]